MRLAKKEDILFVSGCFDYAREFQKNQGFIQWTDDYPNSNTVIDDVRLKKGFIFYNDSMLVGYAYIDFEKDPAYDNIQGQWKNEQKYAVVHRLVFSKHASGKGLSKDIFCLIKEFCINNKVRSIRVDTDKNNKIMQHILEREGFQYCGIINFQGGPKLAYEWNFVSGLEKLKSVNCQTQ